MTWPWDDLDLVNVRQAHILQKQYLTAHAGGNKRPCKKGIEWKTEPRKFYFFRLIAEPKRQRDPSGLLLLFVQLKRFFPTITLRMSFLAILKETLHFLQFVQVIKWSTDAVRCCAMSGRVWHSPLPCAESTPVEIVQSTSTIRTTK